MFANLTDDSLSKKVLSRMRHYFKILVGLNILRIQLIIKRVSGVLHQKTVYWIEDVVSSMTSLDNYICDKRWFLGVCNAHMTLTSATSWKLVIASTLTC